MSDNVEMRYIKHLKVYFQDISNLVGLYDLILTIFMESNLSLL